MSILSLVFGTPAAQSAPTIHAEPAWRFEAVADFRAAEDLLDWLDNHGVSGAEMDALADGRLMVRWPEPL